MSIHTIIEGFCFHCRRDRRFVHKRGRVWQCATCRMESLMPPGYEKLVKPIRVIDVKAERAE